MLYENPNSVQIRLISSTENVAFLRENILKYGPNACGERMSNRNDKNYHIFLILQITRGTIRNSLVEWPVSA